MEGAERNRVGISAEKADAENVVLADEGWAPKDDTCARRDMARQRDFCLCQRAGDAVFHCHRVFAGVDVLENVGVRGAPDPRRLQSAGANLGELLRDLAEPRNARKWLFEGVKLEEADLVGNLVDPPLAGRVLRPRENVQDAPGAGNGRRAERRLEAQGYRRPRRKPTRQGRARLEDEALDPPFVGVRAASLI